MLLKTTPPGLNVSGKILVGAMILVSTGAAEASLQTLSPSQPRSASAGFLSLSTQQKRRIVTWRRRDTSNGPHFILTSDAPLDDYSSYVEGDRLFVRIPQATLANAPRDQSGHGIGDMLVEERDSDIVLSVKVLEKATVRVSQNFNRLEIIFLIYERTNDSSFAPVARGM